MFFIVQGSGAGASATGIRTNIRLRSSHILPAGTLDLARRSGLLWLNLVAETSKLNGVLTGGRTTGPTDSPASVRYLRISDSTRTIVVISHWDQA